MSCSNSFLCAAGRCCLRCRAPDGPGYVSAHAPAAPLAATGSVGLPLPHSSSYIPPLCTHTGGGPAHVLLL